MAKKKEGFFDGLKKSIALGMAVEASKNEKGKPDPYKAAGIALGMGHTSLKDTAQLYAMLENQGAFDDDQNEGSYFVDDSYDNSYDESCDDSWRDYCEDGYEYGIEPEDYETEEEYVEALQEAKYSWRETCIESDTDIEPEDYETEEEYVEALEESENITIPLHITFDEQSDDEYLEKERARREFISEKANTVLAANYLSDNGEFLYSKAVKNHFTLPISLPDENEYREFEFKEIICKIAKRDEQLSLKVWSWCLERFLPYAEYDEYALDDMTIEVIDELYCLPEDYKKTLVHYMDEHLDFRTKLIEAPKDVARNIPQLIAAAIQEELFETAKMIFDVSYIKIRDSWKEIIEFINDIIYRCENYEELESIEYFEKSLFPTVKKCELDMVKDEIGEWEKKITDYIKHIETSCEKYEFSRANSWRAKVPDGSAYGMDPRHYSDEEEYLETFERHKYGWRRWYNSVDTYGLNLNDYETQDEFQQVLMSRMDESRKREQKERQLQQTAEEDKTIYTYCGVQLAKGAYPYSYRTDDPEIKVGDEVIVPVGKNNQEMKGIVVSVGQYARIAVPYPVEKTKFILRKELP